MNDLTEEEVWRVRQNLADEEAAAARSARQSKSGFLRWLRYEGLTFIAQKVLEYSWVALIAIFF